MDSIQQLIASGVLNQLAVVDTKPPGIPELSVEQVKNTYGIPWYRKWWVWGLVGVGVVGTVGIVYVRRKKKR